MAERAMMMGTAPAKMKTILILFLFGIQTSLLADAASTTNDTRTWRLNHEREILAEFADSFQFRISRAIRPHSAQRGSNPSDVRKRKLATRVLTLDGAPLGVGTFSHRMQNEPLPFMRTTTDNRSIQPMEERSVEALMRDRDGRDVDWRNAKPIDPEWRLFGRSAGDDKAAIIAMLAALDALRDQQVSRRLICASFSKAKKKPAHRTSPHI